MSVGTVVHSLSRAVSHNTVSLSSLQGTNAASSGSLVITLLGASHGQLVLCARASIGHSSCESTRWVSASSVACRSGHREAASARVTLSVGQRLASRTLVLSQDSAYVSRVSTWNFAGSGGYSASFLGINFGVSR